MKIRRKPNASEKIAAALLKIQIGVDGVRWLIPEPLRSEGTAKEICAAVEWDHIRRHAEGGDTSPQNIDPLLKADHKVKTNTIDKPEIAKGKRYGKKEQAHRDRLAGIEPEIGDRDGDIVRVTYAELRNAGRPIQSRGFLSKERAKQLRQEYAERRS